MAPTTLTFVGAAGTVTGSKHLLTVDSPRGERRILIDSGLYQGEKKLRRKNWSDFPVPADSISDILLTHAHLDHVGYLPRLVKQGFSGTIWATPSTIDLAHIVLRDSAYLQERDAEHARTYGYSKHRRPLPLYTVNDVEDTLPLMRAVDFDADIDVGGQVSAHWTRAGHILGSASIRVHTPGGDALFSGDLGRPTHPVLRSREIPEGAPTVLLESTYGDREHFETDPGHEKHEVFRDAICRTIDRGGSVLVPAFAVDRTEVVLKVLSDMVAAGQIPSVPIYVDSPMALASLRLYQAASARGELNDEVGGLKLSNLNLIEVRDQEQSQKLNDPKEPSIIVSASGMLTGGRVLHHIEHMLPQAIHTVVLTGYQAVGTRGRALLDGARELKMHGAWVSVQAEVIRDEEFSVHADCSELVDWVRDLVPQPRSVWCVHGEDKAAQALVESLDQELGVHARVAVPEKIIELKK